MVMMKGSLRVNGTFFYESILMITGCTCTRGIPGANIELLVSNAELEIAKRDLLVILIKLVKLNSFQRDIF